MNKEFIYVGKIVNTHGIKGELRILSDFSRKELVFKPGFNIYIGKDKIKEEITSYRHHKEFEMITLKNYYNINEVLKYKGLDVYVTRDSLNISEYLIEDLVGMNVYENKELLGKITNLVYNKLNLLLQVSSSKTFYIPVNGGFIKNVDLKNNRVDVQNTKGLIL
jgi:16S rRNA processing protein RimM